MSELDILSFGETMAMFVAEQTGDLAQVGQFHKRIAGADSNVAIGLSRLGFNVAWLTLKWSIFARARRPATCPSMPSTRRCCKPAICTPPAFRQRCPMPLAHCRSS